MRLISTLLLALLITACSGPPSNPSIDRIELSHGGPWFGAAIAVNRQGAGKYERTNGRGGKTSGSFAITPQQFQRLQHRLEPFRREAVPYSGKKGIELLTRNCPKGVQFVTDQGVFWVRWVGRSTDQLYFADLGCDPARNANQNSELIGIMSSFPIAHR